MGCHSRQNSQQSSFWAVEMWWDTNKVRMWDMQRSRYRVLQAKRKQIKRPGGRRKVDLFKKAWVVGVKWARRKSQEQEIRGDVSRARSHRAVSATAKLALYSRWDEDPLKGCWAKEWCQSTYIFNLNFGCYLENGWKGGKSVRRETRCKDEDQVGG